MVLFWKMLSQLQNENWHLFLESLIALHKLTGNVTFETSVIITQNKNSQASGSAKPLL